MSESFLNTGVLGIPRRFLPNRGIYTRILNSEPARTREVMDPRLGLPVTSRCDMYDELPGPSILEGKASFKFSAKFLLLLLLMEVDKQSERV